MRVLPKNCVFYILFFVSLQLFAQHEEIIISVTGDVPYGSSEVPVFEEQLENHNLYSPSEFFVHLGDIKSGGGSCSESVYRDMSAWLQRLAVPAFIVLGDNEWNDCSNPDQAWEYWEEYFTDFEQNFCGVSAFGVEHQDVRHENFAFVQKGVLFIGINIVGSQPVNQSEWNTRLQQDADWVDAQFTAHVGDVRGAVIFGHAGPGSNRTLFFDQFEQSAGAFAKPVLYIHGDGHKWKHNFPFSSSNILRVQVESGGDADPVQLSITLDDTDPETMFLFELNPFDGVPEYNLPPCIEAGLDTTIENPGTITLNGQAKDDGVPSNPGNLIVNWSKLSGPGAVTFGDASSDTTTATFTSNGTYVLQLSGDDGELQTTSVKTVVVGDPSPYLSVDDVTVLEGDGGTVDAIFTVTLNDANGDAVTVSYETADGSAEAGSDYTSESGILTFDAPKNKTPGGLTESITQTITAEVNGDTDIETDETFFLNLTNATNALIADSQGVGTITSDDLPPLPRIFSFSPDSGSIGTIVTITGENYSDVTEVAFNGTIDPGFTVVSDTQIQATVPAGATSGKIRITNSEGQDSSVTDFIVTNTLAISIIGSGNVTLDPPGGIYENGTEVTLTAAAENGWVFSGWSGDLSGLNTTETLIIDNDKSVTARFSEIGGFEGPISFAEGEIGGASESNIVATNDILTAVEGDLYLAVITMKSQADVVSVSGLGLNWSLVKAQCGGRNQIGLEVWMAIGSPTGDGIVTATLGSAPSNASIAVTRYSGVDAENPIGNFISGNTNGLDGLCSGGDDSNAYNFNMITSADSGAIFCAVGIRNRQHEPGSGYTERMEFTQGSGGNAAGVAIQDRGAPVIASMTVDGTLSGNVDWSVIALEINAGIEAPDLPQYTLTTNISGGGTIALDPSGGVYDSATVVSVTAVPDFGYQFDRWSDDLSGNQNPETLTMDSGKTITAIFTEIPQHTVDIDTAGSGGVTIDPPGGVYFEGSEVMITAIPDVGYQFDGWSVGIVNPAIPDTNWLGIVSTENPDTFVANASYVIIGVFSEVFYTLDIDTIGFGGVTLSPAGSVFQGGTEVILTAVPDAGHRFDDWSGDLVSTENPDTIVMNSDKTITANFSEIPPQYSLTINTDGQGSVTLNPAGGIYDEGTEVILSAVPESGHLFSGWSDSLVSTENPDTIVMTSDKVVTATFTPIPQYTLDIDTVGFGGVTLDPPGGVYFEGTEVILTATPDSGHQFDGWSGGLSGSENPDTVIITSDLTIIAAFSEIPPPPMYTLTVNVNGQGSVTLDPSGGVYEEGTVVTVTAEAGSGNFFSNWSDDLSGNENPETITMDSDKTVTANFISAPGGGAEIILEEIQSGDALAVSSVSTNTALSAVSGHLYLAAISTKNYRAVTAVNGLGLNWSVVHEQCSGRSQTGMSVWMALGVASGDDVVTATLNGSANAVIVVTRYSGVDVNNPIGTTISGNSNGAAGACSGGVDNNGYSFDITTIGGGSVLYGAASMRNKTHTPGSGFTEQVEVSQGSGGSAASIAIEDQTITLPSQVSLNGSFNSNVDWSVVGVEIISGVAGGGFEQYTLDVPTSGSGSVTLDPPGGTYTEGSEVILTAIPDAGHLFSGWSDSLVSTENPDTIVMTSDKVVTATFTPIPQYTLDIDTIGSGGVTLDPPGGIYFEGTEVILTATPDAGHQFDGWSGGLSGSENPDTIIVNSDLAITATFSEIPPTFYTLDIDTVGFGGVTLSPAGTIFQEGTEVILTAVPDAGHRFDDWSGDLVSTENPDTIVMNSDKTITANFSEIPPQYSLTINTDGQGSVTLNPPGGIYDEGTEVILTATPESGHLFSGWSDSLVSTENPDTIIMNSEKVVTATFTPIPQYTLNIDTVGFGGVTLDPPGGTYFEGTEVILTATPDSGYQFDGWSGGLSGSENPDTIIVNSNLAITASFSEIFYTLDIDTVGFGGVTLSPSGNVFPEGTEVILTAVPNSGHQFDDWSGDLVSTENPDTIVMTSDKTVTANFSEIPPQYSLTINTDGQGNVTLNPPGGIYDVGTEVILTATPESGHLFSGWSDSLVSTENPDTIIMNSDKVVTATFTPIPQYTLDIDTVGFGGVTLDPPGGIYDEGTIVTLSGTPDAGHRFDAWSGDLESTDNPETITMDSDKVVTANFSEIPQYTLTVNTSGFGSVTLNPPGSVFEEGTEITLTAVADAGNQFSNWSGDINGSQNPYTLILDADKTITANFIEVSEPIAFEKFHSGGSSGSGTVSTSTNVTAIEGHLYLASVSTKPFTSITSVTGMGLNWTLVDAQCAGRNQTGVETWMAIGTPGGDDVVVAELAGSPSNAAIIVARYSGVHQTNPIGDIVSGNSNGEDGACSGGTDNDVYSFDMSTTASGSYVFGAVAMRNRTHLPGNDYTERSVITQGSGGSIASLSVVDRDVSELSTFTFDGTFNKGVDWAAIGVELRHAGASALKFSSVEIGSIATDRDNDEIFKDAKSGTAKNAAGSSQVVELSYLKFALKGIRVNTIESATLQLPLAAQRPEEIAVYTTSNHFRSSRSQWKADQLSTANAPEISAKPFEIKHFKQNIEWIEADVSSIVIDNGLYSFAIEGYAFNPLNFSSDVKPQLIVQLRSESNLLAENPGDNEINVELLQLSQKPNELFQTASIPEKAELQGNYPNPFNSETTIRYALARDARVKLSIYNVRGQRVQTLVDGVQSAGYKSLIWSGKDAKGNELSSGIYFLRLNIGGQKFTSKLILQK